MILGKRSGKVAGRMVSELVYFNAKFFPNALIPPIRPEKSPIAYSKLCSKNKFNPRNSESKSEVNAHILVPGVKFVTI